MKKMWRYRSSIEFNLGSLTLESLQPSVSTSHSYRKRDKPVRVEHKVRVDVWTVNVFLAERSFLLSKFFEATLEIISVTLFLDQLDRLALVLQYAEGGLEEAEGLRGEEGVKDDVKKGRRG